MPARPAAGKRPDRGQRAIEEAFLDSERHLLSALVLAAWARMRQDPGKAEQAHALTTIMQRLSGTETVLIARRAYASGADGEAGTPHPS